MRKRSIALALSLLTLGGITGGAATLHAANVAAANPLTDHSGKGPLRNFISGQIGRLITLRSELDLSDDQKSQIKAIVVKHREEIVGVVKPLIEKRRAMHEAMLSKDGTDEAAIRAAAESLAKPIGDAAVLGAKIRAEARGVLTPDQLKKVSEFHTQLDAGIDDLIAKMATSPT